MAANDINHVPILYFYKDGTGVMFEEEMNDQNLSDFIIQAVNK
jgi:hypothetical protein